MAKKIYVESGIVISTPYFKCPESGADFESPPEGAEIIPTNEINDDGYSYLEISEENPLSIFNEYYAKGEFASLYIGASFLHKDCNEAYDEYLQRNKDIMEVIEISAIYDKQRNILNRLCFISIIASLEAFICDVILTRITNNEEDFKNYFNALPSGSEKKAMQKLLDEDKIGHWEQRVMEHVMRNSFSDIDRIKKIYRKVFGISLTDHDGKIKKHFRKRHLFAHRNGRKKDGQYVIVTYKELETVLDDTERFAKQIMDKIAD